MMVGFQMKNQVRLLRRVILLPLSILFFLYQLPYMMNHGGIVQNMTKIEWEEKKLDWERIAHFGVNPLRTHRYDHGFMGILSHSPCSTYSSCFVCAHGISVHGSCCCLSLFHPFSENWRIVFGSRWWLWFIPVHIPMVIVRFSSFLFFSLSPLFSL